MVGRIRFALERLGPPRHRSHVAQLYSLGAQIPAICHAVHSAMVSTFWAVRAAARSFARWLALHILHARTFASVVWKRQRTNHPEIRHPLI